MKIAVIVARVLLALPFLIFGVNGLSLYAMGKPLIPIPEPTQELSGGFMAALFTTTFGLVVKILEVLGALFLLSGRFVPLGLVLLGPIAMSIPLTALLGFLVWAYRDSFAGVWRATAQPTGVVRGG